MSFKRRKVANCWKQQQNRGNKFIITEKISNRLYCLKSFMLSCDTIDKALNLLGSKQDYIIKRQGLENKMFSS